MAEYVGILYTITLFAMICARIVVIKWVIINSDIMDPEKVVNLAITKRRGLVPYLSMLNLVYFGN